MFDYFRLIVRALALLTFAAPALAAQTAGDYPNRSIRLVVPFVAGGSTDIVARLVAQKLTEAWDKQVVVDNRSGANGAIGMEIVARATPDGHTLVLGYIANLGTGPALNPKLPYDAIKDFAPISHIVSAPSIAVIHPGIAAKNLQELLALARAKPGMLNYASSGSGTVTHLAGELFKTLGHVNIVHVPFKGGAPALTALMSGEVQMSYENSLIVVPHIKAGKLRALAVTGVQRSKLMPELPTIAEGGLPGYAASGWYGFVAPAAVPKDIVARLSTDIMRILRMPDVVERLSGQGAEPAGGTAEQFGAFIRTEIDKWTRLVKSVNMKAD